MLSVADIPLGPAGFYRVHLRGALRRAGVPPGHHLGARAVRWSGGGALIAQGNYRLAVELLEERSRPLGAPVLGDMSRTIHESLSAVVRYRFWEGDRLLFDHTDSRSSFEYAAERSHSCRTD